VWSAEWAEEEGGGTG